MGAPLERDERVLTGASGGSRHLSKGIGYHEDLDEHPGHNARPLIRDLCLHRVDPALTCLGLVHFKGNICCPGLTIAHLPLRAPVYLEWFLHLLGLNAVVACDWSARNIRLGHNKLEIPCDDDMREGCLDCEWRLWLSLYKCGIHIAILLCSGGCLLWQREERLHMLFSFFPLNGGRKARSLSCRPLSRSMNSDSF